MTTRNSRGRARSLTVAGLTAAASLVSLWAAPGALAGWGELCDDGSHTSVPGIDCGPMALEDDSGSDCRDEPPEARDGKTDGRPDDPDTAGADSGTVHRGGAGGLDRGGDSPPRVGPGMGGGAGGGAMGGGWLD